METRELVFFIAFYLFCAFHYRWKFRKEETFRGRIMVFIACLLFPITFILFLCYGRAKNKS